MESTPFRRVLIFVDNAGADVVLGMIPLAREFLKFGCDVVLAGNSLPAINDITAKELEVVVSKASQHCGILASAHEAGTKAMYVHQGSVPPAQGMPFVSSSGDLLAQVPPQGSNNSETAWVRACTVLGRSDSKQKPLLQILGFAVLTFDVVV